MKTFVVLGMHRSGTSLLAKALHTFDNDPPVNMGELFIDQEDVPQAVKAQMKKSNPQGHFEDHVFMNLNDRILAAAGGSWYNPPSREKILGVSSQFSEEIKSLVSSKQGFWGWKDPRTCLTIDLYHPHLVNPHYVAVFRDPMEVAKSLNKRDKSPIDFGVKLAKIYNARVLEFLNSINIS